MASSNILILGASGQTGKEAASILALGGFPVRVTYRQPDELKPLDGYYSDSYEADYGDVESIKRAMDGCERVLIIQPVTPDMVEHSKNICEAAQSCGVAHVIRVSNMATGPDIKSIIARMHYEADEMVKALGCTYTLLKGANYYQNLIFSALMIIRQRHFALPLGNANVAHIDMRDVARVAAHSLVDTGHENKEYTLTGTEAPTMHMVARKISKVLNTEIKYIGVEPIAATQAFKDQGLPDWPAEAIGTMFMEYASGKYNFVTQDFTNITGEQPRTMEDYLAEHKEYFLREKVG